MNQITYDLRYYGQPRRPLEYRWWEGDYMAHIEFEDHARQWVAAWELKVR